MGITLIMHFTSSICWILQSLQGFEADPSALIWSSMVIIADLSRNLSQFTLSWESCFKDKCQDL